MSTESTESAHLPRHHFATSRFVAFNCLNQKDYHTRCDYPLVLPLHQIEGEVVKLQALDRKIKSSLSLPLRRELKLGESKETPV